jgi:hypothetical protein
MNLPQTLNAEFKRLANDEGKSMDELVEEVAGLIGKSTRQVYNFRSGKWSLAPNSKYVASPPINQCGRTLYNNPALTLGPTNWSPRLLVRSPL